jgi:2,5-diamino-6-(ribosylamino)-4(3H)-pyrimidinone 5'-phosphate reductase
LVGIGTVLEDDPKLTVKKKYVPNPKQPIRIVLDSTGRTPKNAEVLSLDAKTIIFVSDKFQNEFEGAEIIVCGKERIDLPKLCQILDKRDIKTLLVEGGEEVIWSFLKDKLADEFHVFIGSMIIGGEKSPTPAGGEGVETEGDILGLDLKKVEKLGDGILLSYDVKK